MEEDQRKLKEKFEASKARNKVLSNEVKTLKQQAATLLDKGKHDNELIEALLVSQRLDHIFSFTRLTVTEQGGKSRWQPQSRIVWYLV